MQQHLLRQESVNVPVKCFCISGTDNNNNHHHHHHSSSSSSIIIVVVVVVVIIIIIIAFKGTIRDFLQYPHSAANCLKHVRSSGPGATVCKSLATHRALITCTCHVTCYLVRRDSSAIKFKRVEIAFI